MENDNNPASVVNLMNAAFYAGIIYSSLISQNCAAHV